MEGKKLRFVLFFPQIAFAIGGSYFKSRGWVIAEFLCLFWGEGVNLARVSLVVPDHACGRGVGQGVLWDVSGGVWSRMWLESLAGDVAWAVAGSGAWSRNGVGGVAEDALWKVRVLLVIFDCVEVDCGCGWKALRRVLSLVLLVVLDHKKMRTAEIKWCHLLLLDFYWLMDFDGFWWILANSTTAFRKMRWARGLEHLGFRWVWLWELAVIVGDGWLLCLVT